MKASLFIFILFIGLFSPSITKVRADYKNAFNSKEATLQLNKDLTKVKKTDEKLLVAYKGAVLTLMAKYSNEDKAYWENISSSDFFMSSERAKELGIVDVII